MEEGHPVTFRAGPGFCIDEANPLGLQALELGGDVVDAVGEVVQTGSATFEEAGDGGIGTEGLEELDGPDEGDPDALRFQGLGRGTALAREEFEEGATLFDGVHGDGHVVEGPIR